MMAEHRLEIARVSGGRPTTPVTLHMTLVYAGNVPEIRVHEIVAVGDAIRLPPFDFPIDVAGCFSSAKVAWLGSTATPMTLRTLQRQLQQGVLAADFDIDTRAFRPHITVARNIDQDFDPEVITTVDWPVEEFCLMHAISDGTEMRYQPLKVWPLLGEL